MPQRSSTFTAASQYRAALRNAQWEREIRSWAGLVLFAFVTMHLALVVTSTKLGHRRLQLHPLTSRVVTGRYYVYRKL